MAHERLRFPEPTRQTGFQVPAALRDPLRAFLLAAAAIVVVGAVLPWIHAWRPGYGWYDMTGFEGAGDGGFVLELALVAAAFAWSDRAWGSRMLIIVAAPALLGAACALLLRDFHQDGTRYLAGLKNAGGHGTFEAAFWITLAGSLALTAGGVLAVWRARGRIGLAVDTRDALVRGGLGAVGGIAGGVGGFIAGTRIVALLMQGATTGAATSVLVLLSMALAFVGAWVGAIGGASLARLLRRP
jgi:subtilisin family serine protease